MTKGVPALKFRFSDLVHRFVAVSRKLCLIAALVALANLEVIDRVLAFDPLKSGTELAVHGAAPGDKLNMRESASAQSKIVMELPPNASGIIATGRTEQNEADKWIEIRYGGKIGWVHSRFISTKETSSEPVAAETKLAAITDKTTGVRILLPTGIVTKTSTTKFGQNWSSPDDAISIDLLSFPKDERLSDVYERLRTKTNRVLTRSELTADAFVLDGRDGDTVRFSVRARRKGDTIRGLSVAYSTKRAKDFGPLVENIIESFEPFPAAEERTKPKSAPVAVDKTARPPAKANPQALRSTDPVAECDSNEVDRRLAGCSVLIEREGLTDTVRAVALSRRADSYLGKGDYDHGIMDLSEALKLEPSDATIRKRLSAAYYLRGLTCSRDQKLEDAISDYSQAIQLDSANSQAFLARAHTYIAQGHLDQAKADLSAGIAQGSSDEQVKRELADLYERRAAAHYLKEEYTSAADDYSAAIELAESRVELRLMRASVYLAQGDPRALADADRFLIEHPSDVQAQLVRGQARALNREYTSAIDDFASVLKAQPKNVLAWLSRGLAYEQIDQHALAIDDYRMILKLDPRNSAAKRNLQRATAFAKWQKSQN